MQKMISVLMLATLLGTSFGPIVSADVTTSLQKGTTTQTTNIPYLHVKWEMDGTVAQATGTDYAATAGAQFKPVGTYQGDKTITICGVASDSSGLTSIDGVYADLYYPTTIALGPNHEDARQGCGQKITQCNMQKLTRQAAYDLLCGNIQIHNTNLPTWKGQEDYASFCQPTGTYELLQDKAAVYCCEHTLSYEDPAGLYNTVVFAQDGNLSDSVSNQFQYVETQAYETDFSAVNYGTDVQLNLPKDVNGDFTMSAGDGEPTVRNIGNTRLRMVIWQDDMGFGQTGTTWDVNYGTRVVNQNGSVDFTSYLPYTFKPLPANLALNTSTPLLKELNLSETDKMDFQVLVKKWLKDANGTDITSYSGNMRLSAYKANPWTCDSTGVMHPTAPEPTPFPS